MHRKSVFKIKIDFEKSHDSYIYDKNRQDYFLDFFGLYSTLPLGYNHPVFWDTEFRKEYNRVAAVKIPNGELACDESEEFFEEFLKHPDMREFKYIHFCCTGALAIEAAIKIAIDQKGTASPMVISLKESFHGINSYGGFVTDRFFPVSERLDGFPEIGWQKVTNPKIIYDHDGRVDEDAVQLRMKRFLEEFEACVGRYGANNIAVLLIEPIQSTHGDGYFPREFFKKIRELCDQYAICLIFDEVQTGFGSSGTMWYFQQIGIIPDIVVFGKKLQVSGVMACERFDKTFNNPARLEVTWNGNVIDMVRGKYILRGYEKYNILNNVKERSRQLVEGLKKIPQLKNVRATGLLVAFDFQSESERDCFFSDMVEKKFLCNKTIDTTIRLRPNLNVSSDEVNEALNIIRRHFN